MSVNWLTFIVTRFPFGHYRSGMDLRNSPIDLHSIQSRFEQVPILKPNP